MVRRRAFTVVSFVSLLLCLATGVMWIHLQHLECFALDLNYHGVDHWLTVGWGRLRILRQPPPPVPMMTIVMEWPVEFSCPLGLLVATFAIAPALWFRSRVRRSQRLLRGLCACGYDLTGNTSGVCPECGMAIPGKQNATV